MTAVGCAQSTAKLLAEYELRQTVLAGTTFRHVVIHPVTPINSRRLNVYIGGDGSPWIMGRQPAADPTPRNPITLKLMALDKTDSVFIGRPCYFGLASDRNCNTNVWTFSRYSGQTVSSMASVIRHQVLQGEYESVALIGYSGGGTLARLIAPEIPNLTGLLTVAADLDIEAWTDYHGYLPLNDSLNPATQAALPGEIFHAQAVGARDSVVPPSITDSYIAQGHQIDLWLYPDFDHVCCWLDEWPTILARLEAQLSSVAYDD